MPFFLAINFLFSLGGSHSLSHSSPSRSIIKSTIAAFISSSPPGGSSLSNSTSASKVQPSNSDGFKPAWGSHKSGALVSDSASTSTPSDSLGRRQDGPGLRAHGCSCTCFSTLRLFGGWPRDQRFGCMRDGGLCQCDGEMSGLMSRWHQIGLSFLFSFFTDHATFCSNKLVSGAMCSMVPLPIPSKAIASARAQSSKRARIMHRPLWTGPTWVYVLAYCIMYLNVFFSIHNVIPYPPPHPLSECPRARVSVLRVSVMW
jgi:hypothetical protein